MKTNVRRQLYYDDFDKAKRFIELYGDLFQEIKNPQYYEGKLDNGNIVFHMSKENFDKLQEYNIVRHKNVIKYLTIGDSVYQYNKRIWVLC